MILNKAFGTADIVAALILVLLFILIPFISSSKEKNIFKTHNRLPWWLGATSLLIIYWNPTLDMINTRLVIEKGYSGLWFLKDVLLIIGVGPILFVPMWARLKLTTDNQLIRLRFSGQSAKYLQLFRAIYVGFFICAFLGSFYLLGIKKILGYYFDLNDTFFFILILSLTCIIILKNNLLQKVKTDAFVSILFLVLPTLAIYMLVQEYGGISSMTAQLQQTHYPKIQLLPNDLAGQETIPNILVFLAIQWWSVRIMDHSNPNTQRYFSIGDPWNAFKAILLPIVIISFFFGVSSFVWDAALLQFDGSQEAESLFVTILIKALPAGLRGALLITFIFGFITTFEAIISWGASMLALDVVKDNLFPSLAENKMRIVSYFSMLVIGISSIIIATHADSLIVLQKFLFSVGAGVGPVFFLRWFWWRINAWSQITAMLASMVFSIAFDFFYQYEYFATPIDQILLDYSLSYYPLKLIVVTLIVTISWLIVTFLTPPDKINHLKNFTRLTKTGGIWPFSTSQFYWKWKLLAIGFIGLASVLPLWFIWLFKFGSKSEAAFLLAVWVILILLSYLLMRGIILREQRK